jgi:hypothetical protein
MPERCGGAELNLAALMRSEASSRSPRHRWERCFPSAGNWIAAGVTPDYAVVDETRIGRIYREPIHGVMKWRWFLQTMPAPPPNNGVSDTLDEAKAALVKRYEEFKRGK